MKLIDLASTFYGSDSNSAYDAIHVVRERKSKPVSDDVLGADLESLLEDNEILFTILGTARVEDYIRQEWLDADVVGFSVLTTGDDCGSLVVLISRPEDGKA